MLGVGFDWIHPWQKESTIESFFYIDLCIHIVSPILGLKIGVQEDQCDDDEMYVDDIFIFGFHVLGFGWVIACKVDFDQIRSILEDMRFW